MKQLLIGILICCALSPANAQFLKKLKAETEQRFKEKIEQKKTQKIDETTEKAVNKVASVPDSLAKKAGRMIKNRKNRDKTDSTVVSSMPIIDSTAVSTTPTADTTKKY